MQTIEILDIKPFMQLLFQTNTFDSYEFVSALIRTDMTYNLDGHINKDFFTEDEWNAKNASDTPYLLWQTTKERIFSLIKGKKTPSQLKIVLKLSHADTRSVLESTHSNLTATDIDGMFLNILFQDNKLTVICGISYQIFTLEKHLEQEFTSHTLTILKALAITCQ
ncbi:MAG: hypothetical protein K2L07_05305 [Lachnospiraceae bacterium]|nr:hypothetical protein [Lachnospiraceae bacterium]